MLGTELQLQERLYPELRAYGQDLFFFLHFSIPFLNADSTLKHGCQKFHRLYTLCLIGNKCNSLMAQVRALELSLSDPDCPDQCCLPIFEQITAARKMGCPDWI